MVTLKDIAKEVGVSTSTVSRCLRKDPSLSINSETNQKVFEVAKMLGYRNINTSNKPFHFLIINKDTHFLNQIDKGYYYRIREGIEEISSLNGDICHFVTRSTYDKVNFDYSGAIIVGNYSPESTKQLIESLKTENIVFVGKLDFLTNVHDSVAFDVRNSVYIAMDYLKKTKNKSIVFIDGEDLCSIPSFYQKKTHVQSFVENNNEMELFEIIECDGFSANSGYESLKKYLDKNGKIPDAVFTGTDPIAIGVMKALHEKHINAGIDISIISINGDGCGEWTHPQLTSVNIHSTAMGREAMKILHDNALNTINEIPKLVTFQSELIVRESVIDRKN